MISIRRNPASGKIGFPKIAAKRDFWERGAAGAAGKAASAARRPPWRLAATSRRGFGCFAELPFPFGRLGKASRSMAARSREQPALRAAGSSLYYISTGKNQPVEMISIRRNPASGVPSAELRFARANSPRCARPVQVFASFPPAKRAGIHLPFLLVEMIRLELTTYTLRTYRSTG